MASFQPPPTYAPIFVKEITSGELKFNPIWLKWFVDLTRFVTLNGGGGAVDLTTINGLVARVASGSYAARTITGTAGEISVTNGDGVAGNPILALIATGVTPGTFTKITVDSKGRITIGANLSSGDITTALGFTPVNKAGDTMTGLLVLSADPSAALGAATKQYIDSGTITLTNKRITLRITSIISSSTPTPNADTDDAYHLTALAAGATFAAPTGTPTSGQKLIIRIKDNGTAQTLAWNAIYRVIGSTLPTTTVINKTVYVGCIYNSADTKWDVVAVAQEV